MTEILHSIWTLLLFLVFIGIVIWAWSGKRRQGFSEAERLPLEDDLMQKRPEPGEKDLG